MPKGVALDSTDDDRVAFGIGCQRCREELTLVYLHRFIQLLNKERWVDRCRRIQPRHHPCGLAMVSLIALNSSHSL